MIDVGSKEPSERTARARGIPKWKRGTLALIRRGAIPKRDVIATATLAGSTAAKRTSDVIPLCHPLRLSGVEVSVVPLGRDRVRVETRVRALDRTGVEMEALL